MNTTMPDLTALWRTGAANAPIAVEVWGRPSLRDALVRIIAGVDDMDAGSVTNGGTDDALVVWSDRAKARFDPDWLERQAAEVKRVLTFRWAAI
jgi:hypothetical protein